MSVCPVCKTALQLVSYEEKELWQCSQCRGFWFLDGQFRDVKQMGFAALCSADESSQAAHSASDDGAEPMCPDCVNQPLVAYNYAYSSDILLYRCTACKGIWAEQQALTEIEALLENYQESLEEAKAKAMPLMMEVKRQFQEQEEAREAARQKRRKQGLMGRFFRKKPKQQQQPFDVFANLETPSEDAVGHPDADQDRDNQE